jgi:pimeloyl-ACP methyl ester carboxylesterase
MGAWAIGQDWMSVDIPETRYAKSGDLNIAYQALGDGPPDLLFLSDWGGNVEGQWEHRLLARFLLRLASMGRFIAFDRRGIGASDPVPLGNVATIEETMDDALAVLDAVGSPRTVVIGLGSGAPIACVLAATHPERVTSLVLLNGYARFARAPDHPWGLPPPARDRMLAAIEEGWGKGGAAEVFAPSLEHDAEFRSWFARYRRLGASPRLAVEGMRVVFDTDVRHVLPGITVPTLVIHREGDRHVRVGHGRDLAARISGARYVEVPGDDHLPWVGDADAILDVIAEFVIGAPAPAETHRVLATVVFTDIVGSTERAVEMGDERWRRLLDDHDDMVRRQLDRFQGREVKTTGDGFVAAFDGPTRAIHCATAIRDGARSLGLEVRAGVHTGECEQRGDDLGGVAVHIGARIGALAAAGEVLVSSTVKDLVAGSGITFAERGRQTLRGVPDEWQLYAVGGG